MASSGERDETPDERADRNWNELLQEFRVLQTGVQLLSGFLLTLPFQSFFSELDDFQVSVYLMLIILSAMATATVLAPIAVHRRVFQRRRKPQIVRVGHVLSRLALVLVGALVAGTTFFVFDIVLDRTVASLVAAGMLAVVLMALVVLPRVVAARAPEGDSD